ncbi:ATP-dependent nuclease [Bradyrhizobium japonicum]|uniref:ATP-dependent nuclease n=1 Tax=Bradyrhizobium japonicum TaxID=375 RepID=UPI0009B85215|nr:ATP-binding protein [Bradyrhizobium japonicum]
MFKSVRFRNFKSLKDYTVHLRTTNVLVGPNNAGKSTILDAFRAMAAAHRYACRRVQSPISVNGSTVSGYEIPMTNFPISLANVHSDYQTDQETSVTFSLENGNKLQLSFYENARCVMTITEAKQRTATTAQFRKNFPVSIYPFPTLGPLEEEELLLTDEYVRQSEDTRRAHRMFRNIWYRRPQQFPAFEELVAKTWEGMTISKPELNLTFPARLSMFCKEDRIDREVYWAGFGFQVWLQILTHLTGASADNVLVVDEPEIYLHPDLQRRLFQLLKNSNKQLILATHSAEIVNEADHEDVVLVNRTRRTAARVSDADSLQEALNSIGSAQNIHLARLTKGRRILFLEGDDYRLLRRFGSRFSFDSIANDVVITVVPIGGFSQSKRIQDTAWAFEKILKANISIAAVLDRDFRCAEEIVELLKDGRASVPHFHILTSKEIENYLLVPAAITKALQHRLKERKSSVTVSETDIEEMLDGIVASQKADLLGQYVSNRVRYFTTRSAKDPSTVVKEAIEQLEKDWHDRKTTICSGKKAFAALNGQLQQRFGVSITSNQVINHLGPNEVGDLISILSDLDQFARAQPTPLTTA